MAPADSEGENVQILLSYLARSPKVGHVLYERNPQNQERIVAKHQYAGEESALITLVNRHTRELWTLAERATPPTKRIAQFREARVAVQRIEDTLYFTLAYPEDFQFRYANPRSDQRVGTVAYVMTVKADSKSTIEQEAVKVISALPPRLTQIYAQQVNKFFPKADLTDPQTKLDNRLIVTFGDIKFEKGYEKLRILKDVIRKQPKIKETIADEVEFTDQAPSAPERQSEQKRASRSYRSPNPVDRSTFIQVNVPPILEDDNAVFTGLWGSAKALYETYHKDRVVDTSGELEWVTILYKASTENKIVTLRPGEGQLGNITVHGQRIQYRITPEMLYPLAQAVIKWGPNIPHLQTMVERIEHRGKALWTLAQNAYDVSQQRDELAEQLEQARVDMARLRKDPEGQPPYDVVVDQRDKFRRAFGKALAKFSELERRIDQMEA